MTASISDIFEVAVKYSGPGGTQYNTFGFSAKANVAGDAMTDLASAFKTAMVKNTSGGLLYGMAGDMSTSSLQVEDVKPGVAATLDYTYASVAGSSVQANMPPQCAILFSVKTTLKGRSFRGRFYLPGGVQTDETDGLLSAGAITNYTTIATQLMAVFGPSGSNANWQFGVISRYHNNIKRAVPVWTDASSIALDPVIATQRRRRYGT